MSEELEKQELKEEELNKVAGGIRRKKEYRCDDCSHKWDAFSSSACPACKSKNIICLGEGF